MKVAVCYDNLCTKGGHERVVLTLAKAFKADIFTIKYNPEKTFPEFNDINIYSNELKYISGFKLFRIIHTFRHLDLSDYDLVISNGGWSRQVAFNKKNHPVIDYNPGPPGFLKYKSYSDGLIGKIWLNYIKKLDIQAAEKVECLIANSNYVKNIFDKCYALKNKTVDVIYPPINVSIFQNKKSENFFLSVQRITPDKRVDLQIKVFKKLTDTNLLILGSIGNKDYFNQLLKTATNNIKFIIDASDEKVIELYSRCKGVIQTGKGEPFGIVPIEAMASGKPCIAVNEGGYKETIINGKTGLLIDPPYLDNFIFSLKKIDTTRFDKQICRKRSNEFSEELFVEKIKNKINSVMAK